MSESGYRCLLEVLDYKRMKENFQRTSKRQTWQPIPCSSMPLTGDRCTTYMIFHLVFLCTYREVWTAGKESITWRRTCRVTKENRKVNPHGITLLQIMIDVQTKGKPLQLTVRFKDLSCARLTFSFGRSLPSRHSWSITCCLRLIHLFPCLSVSSSLKHLKVMDWTSGSNHKLSWA